MRCPTNQETAGPGATSVDACACQACFGRVAASALTDPLVCEQCAVNTYSAGQMRGYCTACPANTNTLGVSLLGATSIRSCWCRPVGCVACDRGACLLWSHSQQCMHGFLALHRAATTLCCLHAGIRHNRCLHPGEPVPGVHRTPLLIRWDL